METLRASVQALAAQGVYVGTSSWKYPGWLGQIYNEDRYLTRGKFSKARFEATCLAEYARTFSTVCVDAGYYAFPKPEWLAGMADQVPDNFRFAFKVTDEITIRRFPNLPRFGPKAGKDNAEFLNAELFTRAFLGPMESIREKTGPLILEFSHFHKTDFAHGRDFIAALDGFLAQLPKGWQYAVEIRNKSFLHPDYFAMLRERSVSHCFNSWERMPPVSEQLQHEGSITADFITGRFLLSPGRAYQAAVGAFSPYTETREPNEEARSSIAAIFRLTQRNSRGIYLYVNNRLEGNAINTIAASIAKLTGELPAVGPPPAEPDAEPRGDMLL